MRVLAYSLAQTEARHAFVILTLPPVSDKAKLQLEYLGATNNDVEPLAYPFKTKFELGINKQCRYSKLRLWGMTEYAKIIYLDADTVVKKNLDHLFAESATIAGVRDIGDVINTGVLVFTPSTAIFSEMMNTYFDAPSYNRGDQGFINWFFTNHSGIGIDALPVTYNVPPKVKGYSIGPGLIADAYVHHYTAETKPWTFHHFTHKDWAINYHATMFATWRDMDTRVQALLHDGKLLQVSDQPGSLDDKQKADNKQQAPPTTDVHELRHRLSAHVWTHTDRQARLCGRYRPRYENGKYPIRDQYSVAISFHNEDRLPYLPKLVEHYLLSTKVAKVYIIWHSAHIKVPSTMIKLKETGRVAILRQDGDTLNNRFNPIADLKTDALFVADDDIWMPIDDVDFAYDSWRLRPTSIFGFFPRIHGFQSDGTAFYEMAGVYHKYSMILTKAMMISSAFLHAYTCVLPQEIHKYVDYGMNCEDMVMNMMVSGLTGSAPVYVHSAKVYDFGTSHGISISSGFTQRRDQCVQDLVALFGRDTLQVNTETVARYHKNSFQKVTWDKFDDVMDNEAADFRAIDTQKI